MIRFPLIGVAEWYVFMLRSSIIVVFEYNLNTFDRC